MSGPFIVKATSKIHPGKAAAYAPLAAEICRLVEEQEPRVLGFHIYVDEERGSEVVIQIHPDAESMLYHLKVLGEKVRQTFDYSDFQSLEIYGPPSDALMDVLQRATQGIPLTVHPVHWCGFNRLQGNP